MVKNSAGDDPHVLEAGHAPTPFTAAEIREGCPPERMIHLRVELQGEPTATRIIRFLDGDDEGGSQEFFNIDADGAPLGPAVTGRSTWLEFQAHASFPSDRTTVTRERLDTPIGPLTCLRYTLKDRDTIDTFWFAEQLPGMPVQFT